MNNLAPLILVVDDESHILYVMSVKLRDAGYRVLTAHNGKEGLAVAMQQRPDLLITDYQMPYMTGLELCRKLKEHLPTSAVPALMLTARGFGIPKNEIDTNIAAVIAKPFSPHEVLTWVQKLTEPGTSHTVSSEVA